MRITRIVAQADGTSRFEDVAIALADRGKFGFMSDLQAAPGVIFREIAADYDSGWHTVPHRLYLIILVGTLEIEAGMGERRTFGCGSVILAEDAVGAGHRTRAVGGAPVRSLLVNLT